MKLKIILIISLVSIFITGCSSEEEISLVEEGKIALEKSEYEEAKTILSDALESDGSDESARAMYMQACRMLEAEEYEKSEDYKEAIVELEAVEDIKDGSSSVKGKASDKKKELIKLNEEYEAAMKDRKEKAKDTASRDRYRVEKLAAKEMERKLAEEAEKLRKELEAQQQASNNQGSQVQPEQPQPETPAPGGNTPAQ